MTSGKVPPLKAVFSSREERKERHKGNDRKKGDFANMQQNQHAAGKMVIYQLGAEGRSLLNAPVTISGGGEKKKKYTLGDAPENPSAKSMGLKCMSLRRL